MSDPQIPTEPDETPQPDALEEPSTEKNPDEEPEAPAGDDPEPDHEAYGIGIPGRPQTDTEASAR